MLIYLDTINLTKFVTNQIKEILTLLNGDQYFSIDLSESFAIMN